MVTEYVTHDDRTCHVFAMVTEYVTHADRTCHVFCRQLPMLI